MQRVETFEELKNVTAIAWAIREGVEGDAMFAPDKVAVRFEDDAGQYCEIIISSCFQHTKEQYEKERAKAVERLNEIFHSLGLLEGQWVDKDISLNEAMVICRKAFPKKKLEVEEQWWRKEYIF